MTAPTRPTTTAATAATAADDGHGATTATAVAATTDPTASTHARRGRTDRRPMDPLDLRHHGGGPIRGVRPGCRPASRRPIPSSALHRRRPDERRDDRAIVDAVLAGDRDAFRHLVERESASVVRACHRVLGDLHEAEDAAQEAFVTAYRSLASWRGDGPFGAWLTRIAIRIALRQAGKRRSVTLARPGVAGDGGTADPVAGRGDARPRWRRPGRPTRP